jgi:hypothetical protein
LWSSLCSSCGVLSGDFCAALEELFEELWWSSRGALVELFVELFMKLFVEFLVELFEEPLWSSM